MTTETQAPDPAQKWEGAEEWMPLAWELCANECGEEACAELIWEGGPIPEPWGDRWLKYEDQAKEMIAMVRASLAAVQATEGAQLPPLPKVGPIGFASVVDVEAYASWLQIGPHLPGVRDVALWTTDQMRAYARAARAAIPAPEGAQVTDDMRSAVRWAPSSAYWSERLREFFGPDAREGIDALERQLSAALAAPAPQAAPVALTDEQIAAGWKAWPEQSITSAAKAVRFVRSLGIPAPKEPTNGR